MRKRWGIVVCKMKALLTKNDAQEVLHKMSVLADTPDLQEDYEITQIQADELRDSIPVNGGEWNIPDWAVKCVREEMENAVEILRNGPAHDARQNNEHGQALRICKQAKRLESIFC